MKPKSKSCRAFTWVDFLMIIAVLVVLAVVCLPKLAKRYARASKIACTNNLKQVGLAYRSWAIDHGDKFPMRVSLTNGGAMENVEGGIVYSTFLVMSNELNTPKLLICPEESDRNRVVANTFERLASIEATRTRIPFTNDNNVSYFVGVDAEEAKPTRVLGGDDNFLVNGIKPKPGLLLLQTNSLVQWTNKRHNKRGNFLFADGSVMGITNPAIQAVMIRTETATNRLAMP